MFQVLGQFTHGWLVGGTIDKNTHAAETRQVAARTHYADESSSESQSTETKFAELQEQTTAVFSDDTKPESPQHVSVNNLSQTAQAALIAETNRNCWQWLRDWLWGYDFFVSYHWASGGVYAVNLAQMLRSKGFDVFLDRADYASGDDWKQMGQIALRNTQRLVLVATREALTISKPVQHEVEIFTSRGRQVIPIIFGDRFVDLERTSNSTLQRLPESQLFVDSGADSLAVGPPAMIVDELIRTHKVLRRRSLRTWIIAVVISIIFIAVCFAGLFWQNSRWQQQIAAFATVTSYFRFAESEIQQSRPANAVFSFWQAHEAARTSNDIRALNARQLIASWSLHVPRPLLHDGAVRAVAFSPNGQLAVTGGLDNTARLWDARTGQPLAVLPHSGWVNAVAFSPDSKMVLTGSTDTTARIWNAETGLPFSESLPHPGEVWAVAFSPLDGSTILTGSNPVAKLWNVSTGKEVCDALKHTDQVRSVAFSRDGKKVITGSNDNSARLWDVATGKQFGETIMHLDSVRVAVFNPSGTTVMTGSSDRTARICDAETGKKLFELGPHEGPVYTLAFSPDGTMVSTGSDTKGRLWNAKIGELAGSTLNHDNLVLTVEFARDGKTLMTASADRTAKLWDATSCKMLGKPFTHEGTVDAAALSPDGQTILTGSSDQRGALWNVTASRPLGAPIISPGEVWSIAGSPDGKLLITGSGGGPAYIWDVDTGRLKYKLEYHGDRVGAVAISPDGRTAVTGSHDGKAALWSTSTGKQIGRTLEHEGGDFGPVKPVAFSPDGQTVITCRANEVWFWDSQSGIKNGSPLPHKENVAAVAFDKSGQKLMTGGGTIARLWDVRTRKPLTMSFRHDSPIDALAFSDDENTFIAVCGREMWCWDTMTGKSRGVPRAFPGTVVAFSADRQTALLQSDLCRLWDIPAEQMRGESTQEDGLILNTGTFSRTGDKLFAAAWRGDVIAWSVSRPAIDDPERLKLSVEVRTEYFLDESAVRRRLTPSQWHAKWRELARMGGPCDVEPAREVGK